MSAVRATCAGCGHANHQARCAHLDCDCTYVSADARVLAVAVALSRLAERNGVGGDTRAWSQEAAAAVAALDAYDETALRERIAAEIEARILRADDEFPCDEPGCDDCAYVDALRSAAAIARETT